MRKHLSVIKTILASLFLIGLALGIAQILPQPKKVQASLNHTPIFPHILVSLTDYMTGGWNSPYQDPEVREFIKTHYDFMVSGKDYTLDNPNSAMNLIYTNYYCMYTKNPTDDPAVGYNEYVRAYNWAKDHNVNFEDFFIHYKAGTTVSFNYDSDKSSYTLPTQECITNATALGYAEPERTCRRVPTYGWYGTKGDMASSGARVIMNVGNPNYRAWKLDDINLNIFSKASYIDGIGIDNSPINNSVGTKHPENQAGSTDFEEYFRDNNETSAIDGDADLTPGEKYSNDLVTMFREFHERFPDKGQVPNVAQYDDYAYYSNLNPKPELNAKIYPYVIGLAREAALQSDRNYSTALTNLTKNIANSEANGVKYNGIGSIIYGGVSPDPIDRYVMPQLAEFYLIKSSSTVFPPFLQYVYDGWNVDPRINQWFEAVAYNVGQPKNDANDPADPSRKYKVMAIGINPSSPNKTDMNVQSVTKVGYSYHLVDPSANWTDQQWQGKAIIFPDGRAKGVYKSGSNWIDIYWGGNDPAPPVGLYHIGDNSYAVYFREFDNALAIYKPLDATTKKDASTSATEALPVTSDNPTGKYHVLNMDGTVSGEAITSISLRNTDGAVLIKESALNRPSISKSVDKASASSGDTLTYTITYSNPSSITFSNAKIADPIPTGTVFDSIVSGSATFDGTNVVLDLGNLAPNTNGSISFKVRVQ